MYRYFVLIWDRTDALATSAAQALARQLQAASPDWARVVDCEGLLALHAGERANACKTCLLTEERGVVFGNVFKNGSDPSAPLLRARADGALVRGEPLGPCVPMSGFIAPESERIEATQGSHLIDHYWGRYVAIVREPERGRVHVVRDPSGALPCFVMVYRGVSLVFSDMEDCAGFPQFHFTINWNYIAAYIPYSALQLRETGLNEVSEVQPGERWSFEASGELKQTFLWNPAEIAKRDPIENVERATSAIRESVISCVHTWASLHPRIIHNLSGGLDSSMVLSCLQSAPNAPTVTCLHYFSPSSNEDERKFARLAASHMQADLVEYPLDGANTRLDRLRDVRRGAKPWFYIYDLIHSPVETRLAAEKAATAVFSGAAGDGLFLQARADLAVADYLRRHGYRLDVLQVALNAARITRTSLWPILAKGMRLHMKRTTQSDMEEVGRARNLIAPGVFEAARHNENLVHPWIRAAGEMPPGLLWHILCLSVPPMFYESFGGATALNRTVVLLSQPLMELCLRIPSYVWIDGGRDRAIVRRAFSEVLPNAIVRRQQKGTADLHSLAMFEANAAFVREMMCDGLLVQAGLLDRGKLDQYLERGHSRADFEYNSALRHYLCAEVWLQRWSEREQRAAA